MPDPEQMERIIMLEARITTTRSPSPPTPSPPWSRKESVTYDYLQPGTYRASINRGQTWTTIVVAAEPEAKFVEIAAPE